MRRTPEWENAYCEYFAARQQAFMRTAYGIVGNWSSAEDATQQTFAKLYMYWPRIRGDSVDAYARRVLVNTCVAASKASKREIVSDAVPEAPIRGPGPELRLDVLSAMRKLPARDRAVLVLRFLDDLSVKDVADVLQLPTGTVKSQTARALARLEAILADAAQGAHHAH